MFVIASIASVAAAVDVQLSPTLTTNAVSYRGPEFAGGKGSSLSGPPLRPGTPSNALSASGSSFPDSFSVPGVLFGLSLLSLAVRSARRRRSTSARSVSLLPLHSSQPAPETSQPAPEKPSPSSETSSPTPSTKPVQNAGVRVRFAPSPTGSLHVGGARTALYNYFLAKKLGGAFILRIDDTDLARSTTASEKGVLEDLKWLGIDWQEGPASSSSSSSSSSKRIVGKEKELYRQSERAAAGVYSDVLQKLRAKGHVYRCFCSQEELDRMKKEATERGIPPVYRGPWATASQQKIDSEMEKGTPFVWRFRVPNRRVVLQDIIRGRVSWRSGAAIGDFVVMRSDGLPVYNFATAVDDHLMRISHVVRAEEHLPNTLKQLLVYEAMNWTPPKFAHVPLVLAPDRTKLSKRHGATSVKQFAERGVLPQALVAYLMRQDKVVSYVSGKSSSQQGAASTSMDSVTAAVVDKFGLEKIGRKAAIFDEVKLRSLNRKFLSHMDVSQLSRLVGEVLKLRDGEMLRLLVKILRGRLASINDAPGLVQSWLRHDPAPSSTVQSTEQLADSATIQSVAKRLPNYSPAALAIALEQKQEFATASERRAVRFLLTGKWQGPPLAELLRLFELVEGFLRGGERGDGFGEMVRPVFVRWQDRMRFAAAQAAD